MHRRYAHCRRAGPPWSVLRVPVRPSISVARSTSSHGAAPEGAHAGIDAGLAAAVPSGHRPRGHQPSRAPRRVALDRGSGPLLIAHAITFDLLPRPAAAVRLYGGRPAGALAERGNAATKRASSPARKSSGTCLGSRAQPRSNRARRGSARQRSHDGNSLFHIFRESCSVHQPPLEVGHLTVP